MKHFLTLFLLLFLCTACSSGNMRSVPVPEAPPEQIRSSAVQPLPQAEEALSPPAQSALPEPAPVSPPRNQDPAAPPEQEAGTDDASVCPLSWEILSEDGMVEDAVAFDLQQPVFSGADGADSINAYYDELITSLIHHTRDKIYTAVMEAHTMANVCGTADIQAVSSGEIAVCYTYDVEYVSQLAPQSFSQTVRFDVITGQILP